MSTATATLLPCDAETCEVCQTPTVEGNNALGQCESCEHDSQLTWALKAMAAGVTRNPKNGQFASTRKA